MCKGAFVGYVKSSWFRGFTEENFETYRDDSLQDRN